MRWKRRRGGIFSPKIFYKGIRALDEVVRADGARQAGEGSAFHGGKPVKNVVGKRDIRFLAKVGNDGFSAAALERDVLFSRKIERQSARRIFPSEVVVFFGVANNAVEVENKTLYHGKDYIKSGGKSKTEKGGELGYIVFRLRKNGLFCII